jgi:methyl-accepting chemotaxis protein
MHDARESTIRFSNDYQECTFKMKNSDGTWTKMTATLDKFSNKMYSAAGEVTKHGTALGEFAGSLKGEFLKLGRYMIASFGIEEVIQAVRTGITYVKEIDDALTDLKKVTNETDAGYERFLQTMSKTAGVVGSTVAELTQMAAEWSRLGYSMQEAANLAESTAVLLNVSEFEDATTASEALISTIQAFGYAADDSMHVVDILNEVKLLASLYSNVY